MEHKGFFGKLGYMLRHTVFSSPAYGTLGFCLGVWAAFHYGEPGYAIAGPFIVTLTLGPVIGLFIAIIHNVMVKKTEKAAVNSLPIVDYYQLGSAQGYIAVDVKNKQIAVCSRQLSRKLSDPLIFSINKIIKYRPLEQGYSQWESAKGNLDFDATKDNVMRRSQALLDSGIFFELDDINYPEVHAQMPGPQAKSWMLIIKKLSNGTLDEQPSPLQYPIIKQLTPKQVYLKKLIKIVLFSAIVVAALFYNKDAIIEAVWPKAEAPRFDLESYKSVKNAFLYGEGTYIENGLLLGFYRLAVEISSSPIDLVGKMDFTPAEKRKLSEYQATYYNIEGCLMKEVGVTKARQGMREVYKLIPKNLMSNGKFDRFMTKPIAAKSDETTNEMCQKLAKSFINSKAM